MNKIIPSLLAIIYAQATFPAQANLLLLGVSRGASGGYILPALANNYAALAGDSRTDYAGQLLMATPTWTPQIQLMGYGYAGWVYMLSGGAGGGVKLLPEIGWNYGLSSTTTAGLVARMGSARTDCNISTFSSSICFTGNTATTSGATSIGATSILLAGDVTGTLASGMVLTSGVTAPGVVISATPTYDSVAGKTTITISGQTTAAITSGTSLVFSPLAATAQYWAALAAGDTGSITDFQLNRNSDGQYSYCSDPATLKFLAIGTNDANGAGPNIGQSLTNIAKILNNLGPASAGGSGCNNIVVVSDEMPRGLATGYANGGPETASTLTAGYTVTKGSTYWDTPALYYAPAAVTTGAATSATPATIALGTNDGVDLSNCTSGVASAPNGAATCTPALGQYSVSSVGAYTFNAAETAAYAAIYYRWVSTSFNLGASPTRHDDLHNWLNSSNADFSPSTNTSVHIPGAMYNRPWVKTAATWNAQYDSSIVGKSWQKPYMSVDGIHGTAYGNRKVGAAMLAAASAINGIKSTAPYPLSTVHNPVFSATLNSSGVVASTCPSTVKAQYLTSVSPAPSTGIYSVGMAVYAGVPSPGFAGGTVVDCIDTTNGYLHLAGTSTTSGSGIQFFGQTDTVNYLPGGVFNHLAVTAAQSGNCLNSTDTKYYCGVAGSSATANASVPVCSTAPCTISGVTLATGSFYPGSVVTDTGGGLSASTRLLNAYVSSAGATGNWTIVVDKPTTLAAADVLTLTPPTVVQGAPFGWTFSVGGFSSNIYLAAGGSGPLGLRYGVETNPLGDGYDDVVISASGRSSATAFTASVQSPYIGYTTNWLEQLSAVLGQSKLRAQCEVLIYPGANGHLNGLREAKIALNMTSSSTWAPPGYPAANTFTAVSAVAGNGGSGEYNDGDASDTISPGYSAPVQMTLISPLGRGDLMAAFVAGTAGIKTFLNITMTVAPSAPQSWMARVRRCGIYKATGE